MFSDDASHLDFMEVIVNGQLHSIRQRFSYGFSPDRYAEGPHSFAAVFQDNFLKPLSPSLVLMEPFGVLHYDELGRQSAVIYCFL